MADHNQKTADSRAAAAAATFSMIFTSYLSLDAAAAEASTG